MPGSPQNLFSASFLVFCLASLVADAVSRATTSFRRSMPDNFACIFGPRPALALKRPLVWWMRWIVTSGPRYLPLSSSGILDNIGLPTSGINLSYSNSGTIGNADAEILGSLQPNHHPTADYVARLREELPKRFPGTSFFFEPADIVAQTLNFGVPAPLDIQIVGKDVNANFAIASQIAEQMRAVPGAVDVHIQQLLDQPRLQFDVDRVRIQQVGLTEHDVASNVLVSLSSSFQTQPNFWLNTANGVSYNIAVQTPQYKIHSLDTIRTIPVNSPTASSPQLFENLASMTRKSEPAVVSHYNVQPVIDVYASVHRARSG